MKHSKNKYPILILFISLLFIIPLSSFACGPYGANMETSKTVNSRIKSVTVFLSGAQVHRSGNFNAQPGVSEIVFDGLSQYINPKSIQAKGRGNFTILDVRHRIHYPEPKIIRNEGLPIHIKKKIARLEDSLFNIRFDLAEIKTNKEALELEKKILLNTEMLKGKGKSKDSIPLLKDGMLFFREKLNDINRLNFVLNKKEQRKLALKASMDERLSKLKQYKAHTVNQTPNTPPVQQIVVTVSSKTSARASLDISYMVSQAGWSAQYDIRAKNTNSPIKLTYKAKVYQQTGENWSNVKLKLSTNNPNKGSIKPTLPIWYLNYRANRQVMLSNLSIATGNSVRKERLLEESGVTNSTINFNSLDEEALSSANYTQMAENIANVEFNIDLPYSIQSNGESHLVEVQTSTLPSKFYHTIVPKLDNEAFVMAKVSDWENLNLLPASANIFFDGTYIGETMINPLQLEDTLNLSLGRDASVIVKRTKIKDNEKSSTIGNHKIKTIHFELALKNKKLSDINLIVEDHIPVSNNEEIKVELKEKGDAQFNEKTGMLTWNLNLAKGEDKELDFSYSIKYDKDKSLLGAL